LLSALLRVLVYFQNRTLFLDEANLSRNVVEKPYGELFGALDYEQFAPPMYLVVVKAFVGILGVNEYALRLFSLLLGFGALYFFYRLGRKFFTDIGMLYAIALFGFSIYMMRYQTENKQYAGDVFFILLFIFSTWHFKIKEYWQYGILGLVGALGIWFSMPLVFTLAAIGCYLLYENLIKADDLPARKKAFAGLSLTSVLWLGSFALLFFINLKTSLDSKYLQDFHKHYYLKFPISQANINQCFSVWNSYLSSLVGELSRVRAWAEICILLGIWRLFRRDIGKGILLVGPIAFCFIASMMGQYVLMPRVSLFMMPIFFLLIGFGAEFIYIKAVGLKSRIKYLILPIMLFLAYYSLSVKTGVPYFFEEYEIATSRSILKKMSEHPENTLPLYVIHIAKPTYRFYTQLYDDRIEIPSSSIQYGHWSDKLPELAKQWKAKGIDKIWIYDSHTWGGKLKQLKKDIASIGETETLIPGNHGNAYLIKLN
ncbi:MAG: glycosyltransferase family 39 protein, partial [Saprospiraceae bacterium]